MDSEVGELNESVVLLGPRSRPRVGILTVPSGEQGDAHTAVLFLNAGLLHRIGPHRTYVNIARALSAIGYVCLRFDFSGIGDSARRMDRTSFSEAATLETREAMDHVQRRCRVDRFLLVGICSGAEIALRVAVTDPRVGGAALVNGMFGERGPEGGEAPAAENAETRTRMRYYTKKVRSWRSLLRLLTFRSNYRTLASTLLRSVSGRLKRRSQSRTAEVPELAPVWAMLSRGVALLVVCSEGSTALDFLHGRFGSSMDRLRAEHPRLRVDILKNVDHVFTPIWAQDLLRDLIVEWVVESEASGASGSGSGVAPASA